MMKSYLALTICLCLLATGCGAPRPAAVKEQGMRPVNEMKYYPYLTDSERRKLIKAMEPKQKETEKGTVFEIQTEYGGGS